MEVQTIGLDYQIVIILILVATLQLIGKFGFMVLLEVIDFGVNLMALIMKFI
jgi:hypothetical protein